MKRLISDDISENAGENAGENKMQRKDNHTEYKDMRLKDKKGIEDRCGDAKACRAESAVDGKSEEDLPVTELFVDIRHVKGLKNIAIVFAVVAAMTMLIALTLYFRPLMFEWGQSGYFYILWILIFVFCTTLAAVKGAEAVCHKIKGGISVTEGIFCGNAGLFCQTAVSIPTDCIESVYIKHSRWSGYTLTVNGCKFYHYVSPFEFKEFLLKDAKKSNEAEGANVI